MPVHFRFAKIDDFVRYKIYSKRSFTVEWVKGWGEEGILVVWTSNNSRCISIFLCSVNGTHPYYWSTPITTTERTFRNSLNVTANSQYDEMRKSVLFFPCLILLSSSSSSSNSIICSYCGNTVNAAISKIYGKQLLHWTFYTINFLKSSVLLAWNNYINKVFSWVWSVRTSWCRNFIWHESLIIYKQNVISTFL